MHNMATTCEKEKQIGFKIAFFPLVSIFTNKEGLRAFLCYELVFEYVFMKICSSVETSNWTY